MTNKLPSPRIAPLAIVILLSVALPARASNPADAPAAVEDLQSVGLLAALNAASKKTALSDRRLGKDIDRAANQLSGRRVARPAALESKKAGRASTLGIGAINNHGQSAVYPTLYAGNVDRKLRVRDARTSRRAASVFARLTERVNACYGQPLAGHNQASDRLTVGVAIDTRGKVLSAGVVKDARWGASDLDGCLVPALRNARFPAGLGPVELRYTWTFRFQQSDFDFDR